MDSPGFAIHGRKLGAKDRSVEIPPIDEVLYTSIPVQVGFI